MSELKPVVIRGEGIIGADGAWYPETQVRAFVERVNAMCDWFESLPPTVQDIACWESEMRDHHADGP